VAGIIGGNGFSSKGKYIGVAPECNLIGVKVLDHRGDGNISDVLAGLQWIMDNRKKYNIRIVNISVGTSSKDNLDENSLLVQGVNAVWDRGIIVVVAAGNNGPGPMSISTPGISRKVITVGSSDDNIVVEVYGSGKSKDYSGRGPTPFCIKKPDIVAPGSNIISCNISRYSTRPKSSDSPMMYTVKSGTSMATPVVSGSIALLLGAHPELSNREVKLRLRGCAVDLGQHWEKQGWGLLNIRKLLEQ
jgi:serine protease AprX